MKTKSMIPSKFALVAAMSLASFATFAEPIATYPSYSPLWTRQQDLNPEAFHKQMTTPACRDFYRFAILGKGRGAVKSTRFFMFIRNDQVLFDFYEGGNDPETPQRLWSGSKLITALILGTAVKEGRISLDQKLDEFFPSSVYRVGFKDNDEYKKITIRDLLFMRSGLYWREMGPNPDVKSLDILHLLYSPESADVGRYIATRPMDKRGAGIFAYSTGDFTMIMAVLKKVYGADYDRMPWKNLFDPLGVKNVTIERDDKGVFVGGAYIFLSPVGMARIGNLLQNNGVYQGKRILPEDWIPMMQTPNIGMIREDYPVERIRDLHNAMGATFYINAVMRGVPLPYPSLPDNVLLAVGMLGQSIMVLPSANITIIRTGTDITYGKKVHEMTRKALECFAPEQIVHREKAGPR